MTDDLDTLDRDEGDDVEAEAGEGAAEPEEPQPWAKTSSGDAESI